MYKKDNILKDILTRVWHSAIIRLALYFIILMILSWMLMKMFPTFTEMFKITTESNKLVELSSSKKDIIESRKWLGNIPGQLGALITTLISMGVSILLAIPVAWIYTISKQRLGYEREVVQMIILLPIAVTGVVLVVFGDLALAFALGGIVAAVRFRTTLRDVKDAVFAFVAIGIGLAAGIQAFSIAAVLTLIFCIVVLGLWKFDVGYIYRDVTRTGKPVHLADALIPGDEKTTIVLGDTELIKKLTHKQISNVVERALQLEKYILANSQMKKTRHYKHLLLVHASDEKKALKKVEKILTEAAKQWRLTEVIPVPSVNACTLQFLVRLDDTIDPYGFAEMLLENGKPAVGAVELKPVKSVTTRSS
ncbi:MAG: DUF4956 domain-containing protein [Calditrichaeota bacterium]|nr:MAG: DUF4956 domain-containing protein [Calditrichota bacterium]